MMMTKYIWQHASWPNLTWDEKRVLNTLKLALKDQAYILGNIHFFDVKVEANVLIEEAMTTSAIEGEILDRESVRSFVAKRLGLEVAGISKIKRNSDGLIEILLDATTNFKSTLTHERLCSWQAALFPTSFSGMTKIDVGSYRKGEENMQVVSGRIGKEKIHYIAPPSKKIKNEMNQFLKWWNKKDPNTNGIVRAAIAHFWFVSIHPFDDGNGRVARVLTDMALAQDERTSKRLYSLSSQILKDKKNYYEALERAQKGTGDITEWIIWFLSMFSKSINHSKKVIEKTVFIASYYQKLETIQLNPRQIKVIRKLLEHLPEDFVGGLTNKKYVSMTNVSPETAKRDLKDLLDLGILIQNEGKGRSTSYRINSDL
jgi:Fic family protein